MAGLRWGLGTGSRFVSGTYEPFKTQAYLDSVKPGDVVFDVGAHVGYYVALASQQVRPTGQVIAFEPRPLNLRFLKRHIRWNGLTNVQVLEVAVASEPGNASFDTRTGTGTGRLSTGGDLLVQTVSLDDLRRRGDLPAPDLLKVDVEGGELGVLNGAVETIRDSKPIILVATHDATIHAEVTAFLDRLGYEWRVLDTQGRSGDTEILAKPVPGKEDGRAQ